MNGLYHDFRTGGHTYTVIVFRGEDGDAGYSPEYFEEHSEHVTLSADESNAVLS